MSTSTIFPGPSANFSCALFTITYTPAGLAYTPSLLLHHWLIYLQALSSHIFLPLLYTIVFATTLYQIHARLRNLEAVASTPHPAPKDHSKHICAILHNTLRALVLTQSDIQEVVSKFSEFGEDMDAMDGDMAKIAERVNLVSKTLAVLENNVEMARGIIGTGVSEEEDDDDGLDMGDDVEMFWLEDSGASEDGEEEVEEEEERVDVRESNALVKDWLERCAWPDECYDA
jgi:hypothetical protein